MAQHFLLTSKARMLSPIKIAWLSDGEAFSMLCGIRWGSKKHVVCPKCGVQHQAYFISTRKRWRCKHCKYTFSITSGRIFANHKLPIQTHLFAIALFVNTVKEVSACQLSSYLNVQYKTAFTMAHKIRESLIVQRELFPCWGGNRKATSCHWDYAREALTDEHDTELYTYQTHKRHFKGKLRQMVLAEMKAQPNHEFTVNKLIQFVVR
jgi:hypothetical protein